MVSSNFTDPKSGVPGSAAPRRARQTRQYLPTVAEPGTSAPVALNSLKG